MSQIAEARVAPDILEVADDADDKPGAKAKLFSSCLKKKSAKKDSSSSSTTRKEPAAKPAKKFGMWDGVITGQFRVASLSFTSMRFLVLLSFFFKYHVAKSLSYALSSGCLLNTFGVVMFLRIPWIVGNVGIWQAVLIVVCASILLIITTMSMSAVVTNGKMKVRVVSKL